jgi:hypothetical protein
MFTTASIRSTSAVALACATVVSLSSLPAAAQSATQPASNTAHSFNPAISVILSGTYANLSKNPETWRLKGFVPSGDEIGPGQRSFSLGESEIGLSANIDPYFFGSAVFAISGDNEIAAEEAFIQTTALPDGWKIKAGRFFSGLGYLNEQHAHTWDFMDAPLAYQGMVGGQYGQEGVQAKWLAPTDQFIELGVDAGNGSRFPGTSRNRNGSGSAVVFAHTGGDLGSSHSWRAGASYLHTKAQDRAWTDPQDERLNHAFTGTSKLWVLDGVWKWAPNGNATQTNLKLQGEYFRRAENGTAIYNVDSVDSAANPDAYRTAQSGWYVQGVYQFAPRWRAGMRFDQLSSGTIEAGSKPKRSSVMLDWSLSEFSKIRMQYSHDQSRVETSDRQLFVQYQMSLGAHGAHSY